MLAAHLQFVSGISGEKKYVSLFIHPLLSFLFSAQSSCLLVSLGLDQTDSDYGSGLGRYREICKIKLSLPASSLDVFTLSCGK